jgi:sulfate adenylyltransferase subunit 1
MEDKLAFAFPPMSVSITLEDDIDISRGDMIVKEDAMPSISQDIEITMCWMNQKPLRIGGKYNLMHTTKEVKCIVKEVLYKLNVNTLEKITEDKEVRLNSIAKVLIKTTKPLIFDAYKENRVTGSLILIDEATNETVGVGMIG